MKKRTGNNCAPAFLRPIRGFSTAHVDTGLDQRKSLQGHRYDKSVEPLCYEPAKPSTKKFLDQKRLQPNLIFLAR